MHIISIFTTEHHRWNSVQRLLVFTTAHNRRNSVQRLLVFTHAHHFYIHSWTSPLKLRAEVVSIHNCTSPPKLRAEVVSIHICTLFPYSQLNVIRLLRKLSRSGRIKHGINLHLKTWNPIKLHLMTYAGGLFDTQRSVNGTGFTSKH